MPFQQIPTRRARIIVPPEAGVTAAQLRSLARETMELGREAASLLQAIDAGWRGAARDRFFQIFASAPGRADEAASLADQLAGEVEGITVTVWDTVLETIWYPDQAFNS